MYIKDYKCPHLINGWEHRKFGSGWAYGTIEGGRGNGNSYFRMTLFPGVNKNYDVNILFICI